MSSRVGAGSSQSVSLLGRRSVKTLQTQARTKGQLWLHADCAGALGKRQVMAALAKGFGLPAHFGGNLDALYDCLTDLEAPSGKEPGIVLVVEHLTACEGFDAQQIDAVLEVLADACDHYREQGIGFRAFYSLSDGSPTLP
jgi:RNAse (barnase) inhibitor barstar